MTTVVLYWVLDVFLEKTTHRTISCTAISRAVIVLHQYILHDMSTLWTQDTHYSSAKKQAKNTFWVIVLINHVGTPRLMHFFTFWSLKTACLMQLTLLPSISPHTATQHHCNNLYDTWSWMQSMLLFYDLFPEQPICPLIWWRPEKLLLTEILARCQSVCFISIQLKLDI